MNNVTKRIDIDLYSPTSYEVIRAQQGDNLSRIVEFALYDQGNPYTIPDNVSIKMEGHRGDNSCFIKDCTIADNIITVILDGDILYEAGTIKAKIVMRDLSNDITNDTILSTIPFKIYVQKNPCNKNEIVNKKSSVIDWLIQNIEKLKAALDKKANIDSPTLTGIPNAPTATADTNSTQIATTAFTHTAVNNHNYSSTAHNDIRDLISGLTTRLNALADSDDTTLDQLSEIVAYIKANRSLIDSITTSKVNISDIIDSLTSTTTDKPLSAKQGKVLNDLITSLTTIVDNKVDKVEGKGLSTNDYTDEEKDKVASISSGSVTGVKGNAETEYRKGDVNITPADIGALALTGGNVSGRTKFNQGIFIHNIYCNTPETIYVKACTIKITGTWVDSPIIFDVTERGGFFHTIVLTFTGDAGLDPPLHRFSYFGTPLRVPYIRKTDTGTWDIYLGINIYGALDISSIRMTYYENDKINNGKGIIWSSDFVSSVPSDSIAATLGEYNVISTQANTLRKSGNGAPMTFNYVGKNEQPAWIWGVSANTDGSQEYVYSPANITCGRATADASGNNIVDTYALKKYFTTDSVGPKIANPDGTALMWNTSIEGIALGAWNKGIPNTFYGVKIDAFNTTGRLVPYYDNKMDLGDNLLRWRQVYAATSTISTSDRNEKKDIEDLDDEQITSFIMGLKPKSFKFIDGSSGRTHTGLIAQDVEELLEDLGMSTLDFAGFIKSPKTRTIEKEADLEVEKDEENVLEKKAAVEEIIEGEYIYGLRYEEFISPLIKMVQIQQEKINELVNANEKLMKKMEIFESTFE